MAAKLVALYRHPTNAGAFNDYYRSKHIPLAKTIPGLRKYDINSTAVAGAHGESPYHRIATLSFDSLADLQAVLGSQQGQAAAADTANFADNGVELYFFETEEV